MIGIYAIRNKVNGKVYVGQSRNIQKRFKQHLDALEKGVHHSKKLQKDFDELGADKFVLELLELCPSDQLDQKEMEWIAKLDALQNGYNVQEPYTELPRFKNHNWVKEDSQTTDSTDGKMFAGVIVAFVIILLGYLIYKIFGDTGAEFYIAFICTLIAVAGVTDIVKGNSGQNS